MEKRTWIPTNKVMAGGFASSVTTLLVPIVERATSYSMSMDEVQALMVIIGVFFAYITPDQKVERQIDIKAFVAEHQEEIAEIWREGVK